MTGPEAAVVWSIRLPAAASGAVLCCLLGCGRTTGSEPSTQQASPTAPTVERQGDEEPKVIAPASNQPVFPEPATLDELTTRFPVAQKLAHFQQDATVGVLNAVPAPCEACPDASLGRCALEGPPSCPNLPGLVARVLQILGSGGSPLKARDSVLYSDAWFPVPADHTPLAEFTGSVDLQVFVDPTGSFLDLAVESLVALERADASVTLRYLPAADKPHAESLSRGIMAAEKQGRGLAFLQATSAWKAANRAEERRGEDPLGQGAAVAIATALLEDGLDLDRWLADQSDPALAERIADDQLLASQIGVRATPTWFVNGYRLRGAQSPSSVDRLVQLEKEAQVWDLSQP